MDDLANRFETHRAQLRAVAYRMLGSLSEAEDAVQETWLRLGRAETSDVDNLRGWLTTVTARVCLDMLRARKVRDRVYVPDPVVGTDPAQQMLLADAVGLALIVILETLEPAERLAFVLHDMFGVTFEEIAPIVDRTPAAARQLASRARRRIQDCPVPDADLARQRTVVDAFLAASREGNFEALLAVLDPEVVLRGDRGPNAPAAFTRVVRGAREVMKGVLAGAKHASAARIERPTLVNGAAGCLIVVDGQVFSVLAFTVVGDKIVEINVLADPERLRALQLEI